MTQTVGREQLPAQRVAQEPVAPPRPLPERVVPPVAWTPDVHWSVDQCCWVRHR